MNDAEAKLRRELQELKTEVVRLRRIVQCGVAVIATAIAVICPDLLFVAAVAGVMILFALLISPVRHLIFPSVFKKPDSYKYDS